MNKLENLPKITDRALDGLRADDVLKTRILNAALQQDKPSGKQLRFIPVLLSSVALMILCVFLLNGKKPLLPEEEQHLIHSFSAGNSVTEPIAFNEFTAIDPDTIESMELTSGSKQTSSEQLVRLAEMLRSGSEPAPDNSISELKGSLEINTSSGRSISLPAEPPYIGWSDGVRKCEAFFEMFKEMPD